MSHPPEIAETWAALAAALGTTTRTLERWRERYPDEWPRPMEGTHQVQEWREFAFERGLRPAEVWEATPTGPRPKAASPAPSTADAPSWPRRRDFLFDLLEEVHFAYADGQIDLVQYMEIGSATALKVCELAAVWGVEIDAPGYFKNWRGVLATAALKRDERNRANAAAR